MVSVGVGWWKALLLWLFVRIFVVDAHRVLLQLTQFMCG